MYAHTRARLTCTVVLVCYCNGEWLHTLQRHNSWLLAHQQRLSSQLSSTLLLQIRIEWNLAGTDDALCIRYTQSGDCRTFLVSLALCFLKTQAYAINRCNYEIDFTSLHTHAHLRNVFTNRCACGDAMCVYFRNKKMKKTHKKPDESYRWRKICRILPSLLSPKKTQHTFTLNWI